MPPYTRVKPKTTFIFSEILSLASQITENLKTLTITVLSSLSTNMLNQWQ